MSAEAVGWVFRHSPYTGETLVIHLAIADVVNDVYGHRFWMPVPELATKARCDDRTVQRALRTMESDKMIKRLKAGGGRGKPAEYVMYFPVSNDMESPETKGGDLSPIRSETVTTDAVNGDIDDSAPSLSKSNQALSVGEPPTLEAVRLKRSTYPPDFELAWSAYPRKSGKRTAYRSWRARVMDAPRQGISRERRINAMTIAAANFATAMRAEAREQQYIMYAEKFYGPSEPWREFVHARPAADDRPDEPWSSSRANHG